MILYCVNFHKICTNPLVLPCLFTYSNCEILYEIAVNINKTKIMIVSERDADDINAELQNDGLKNRKIKYHSSQINSRDGE